MKALNKLTPKLRMTLVSRKLELDLKGFVDNLIRMKLFRKTKPNQSAIR